MATRMNKQMLLASRPTGWVQESNFRLVETPVPEITDGQVLVQNSYLSLNPYMRGIMNDAKSYTAKAELNEVMVGGTIGTVIESKNPDFQVNDHVLGYFGWQQYGISHGKGLTKITDTAAVPLTAYLGVAGMPGLTAWVGLIEIGEPKQGETVVVSAASGAVGSVVGQLAKARGCRAVGIAGGKEKCDYVVNELGLDACIDYKAGNLREELARAAPNGIDIYFDNVGGEVTDTVFEHLNAFSRVPLCGTVSQYNAQQPYRMRNYGAILINRTKVQGFIVSEHAHSHAQARKELQELIASGKLKYRESIAEGLENAPRALIGMLRGENFGKQLVKLV
ncbi:MAG TPA: NADP-dependent oxidoreductase [Ktedonobacteraceae bacterium]